MRNEMHKNNGRKWMAAPLVIGLTTVGAAGVLLAQPDAGEQGKGDNPVHRRGGRGDRPDFRNMTPAQRKPP